MKYHNIRPIDEMMHEMVQSFVKHFLEIEERRKKNQDLLAHRDALYKKETMQTFQKLQKFITSMLQRLQNYMITHVDEEWEKWTKFKDEIHTLLNKKAYTELFARRIEIQRNEESMRKYITQSNFFMTEDCLFTQVKFEIYSKIQAAFTNL